VDAGRTVTRCSRGSNASAAAGGAAGTTAAAAGSAPEGEFSGEIVLIEPLGVETIVHIKSGSQPLLSTEAGISAWKVGEPVRFNIVRDRLHYFSSDGNRVV
jgi:ABC-type sugar transport system ATPase subunit